MKKNTGIQEGTFMWEASEDYKHNAIITKYMRWLQEKKGLEFTDYHSLWRWSVDEIEAFWESIWEYFSVHSPTPYKSILSSLEMPGAKWFQGSHVNFAEHLLDNHLTSETAIFSESETRDSGQLSWNELRSNVFRLATELRNLGVQPGDRVAAYLPSIPETVVALLATTSIGAIWSSCSPDFGVKSILDRFQQIEPKVLIGIDGYTFGGKAMDCRKNRKELENNLPTLEVCIHVPYLYDKPNETPSKNHLLWQDILQRQAGAEDSFAFAETPFSAPLWILYSSGTTGAPKGIVHSNGGMLIEMKKFLSLQTNLTEEDVLFFYTSTGWMIFNLLVSGLVAGSSIVLYDGNPAYPSGDVLWKIAERTKTTMLGSSPTYIQMMAKAGLVPKEVMDTSHLNGVILSGAPVGPEVFEWLYDNVKQDLWVTSQSGGTDICSGFVASAPIEPVHAGEIQVRALGVDVHAYDEEGKSVINEVGEMVIQKPMPSMPVYFWNDAGNKRYKDSYFTMYSGVWRHGDFIKITNRGSAVISGRSDSTLNRKGIRIGTNEIYSIVEQNEKVKDSLIVNIDLPKGRFFMPLFVVLKPGVTLDEYLKQELFQQIKESASPRHVPDDVVEVDEIPYTLTNKKMEVPVRRILMGKEESEAANHDAMLNPTSLAFFTKYRTQF